MTDEVNANTNDKGNEPIEDESMADAFDFVVPDGNPDDLSELSDDDSARAGDDDSAGDKEGEGDGDDKQAKDQAIDPRLLIRAGKMGLSDDEADRLLGLGSNEAIEGMLDILESRKPASSGGGTGDAEKVEFYEFSDEAMEDIAPELAEVLKSMNGSTKKAVEQMFGMYEKRINELGEQLAGRDNDVFTEAVESLGKEWEPIFGKGDKTDGRSEHGRNLQRLKKAVFSDLYSGSVSRRVKEAASGLFAEHSQKLAKDADVKKARNRQGRFIGKPAQRAMNDADMSPRQRAVANVSRMAKERGIHPEQTEAVDYSEIL